MGDLHVAQIKRRLQDTTYPHIDVSDLSAHTGEHVEQARLTRALAAFVLTKVAGLSDEYAARSAFGRTRVPIDVSVEIQMSTLWCQPISGDQAAAFDAGSRVEPGESDRL